ncbi:MAG: hydroxymethylglutaryl-CoA reductase [Bacteroidota bacterium]
MNNRQLQKFPRGYSQQDLEERKRFLEVRNDICLDKAEDPDPESMKGIIENQIGYLSIPMGMAGPLQISGTYLEGTRYVPLCTVEGTLVASMARGMYATSRCNGIRTTHFHQRMTRSPIFFFENISHQKRFLDWVGDHEQDIREIAESSSNYAKLISIETYQLNQYVVLDFAYTTGNAAGQNMASKATMRACELIRKETGVDFILDSNLSGDKKASGNTKLKGRGHHVTAHTQITDQVIEKVLGTTAEKIMMIQEYGPYVSSLANSNGIQLHLSNALTAIYLATGQDVACVAENAVGYTQIKRTETGLEFLLTMPSISVGTVGGGTRLPQQKKNLELLKCHVGEDSAASLAEIICASALCLEISLMAAIVSEKWVDSHMRYGRTSL